MKEVSGIDLCAVSLTLAQHRIFDRLNLRFEAGQWHSILGRSGTGKSCLLRLVAGLQKPDSGSIKSFNDKPVSRQIAYMAQDDGLLPWLTNLDNIQLGPRLRGERSTTSRQRALALIERVGLAEWADALPAVLSGGMRQRIALARTLFEDQPVVLMDEPFSRLDAITRDELQVLASDLLSNCTVLLVTHDPVEALRLSHTVHILNGDINGDLNGDLKGDLKGDSPSAVHTIQLSALPPRAFDDAYIQKKLPELWHYLKTLTPRLEHTLNA